MTDATPKTAREFVGSMLRSSIEGDRLAAERINEPRFMEAHSHTAVNGLVAGLAMEMLRRHDPQTADDLAEHLDEIFTNGDVGGPAWRTAKVAGFAPDQWIAEFNERAARRKGHVDRSRLMEKVVVQHIVDGLHSGDPVAAAMGRSLMTELDTAGLDVSAAVKAVSD